MESSEDVNYILVKDKIKYPTYLNEDFQKEIDQPLTEEIFKNDITSLVDLANKFLTTYLETIKNNQNDINTISSKYKKLTVKYYFLTRAYIKLIEIIEAKINVTNFNFITDESKLDELINEFIESSKELKQIVSKQFTNEPKNKIKEECSVTFENIIKISNSEHRPGKIMIDLSIKYGKYMFRSIIEQLDKFRSIENFKVSNPETMKENEMVLFDLIILLDKIIALNFCLGNSYFIDEDDIFNKPEDSEEWKSIENVLTRVAPKEKYIIKNEIDKLAKGMGVTNAVVSYAFSSQNNLPNVIRSIYASLWYRWYPNNGAYDSKISEIEDNRANTVIHVFNLMKNYYMKKLTLLGYPKINFRKKLYLKRELQEINEDFIKIIVNNLKENKFTEIKELKNEDNNVLKDLYLEKIEKKNKKFYVSTRLINSSEIIFPNYKNSSNWFSFFSSSVKEIKTKNKALFIHIHGGGFIGTTTITHEAYLRNWANHLNIPIIGIDYSLSPHSKYPKALNDIYQAYNWIINHAEREFNISTEKIIISGDSAGGNLVLALAFLLIATKKRIPDLIIPEYPCCNTGLNQMSPSILLCMEDFLLNFKFLTFCNKAYRDNYTDELDPFLNPEYVPDFIIKEMPKTLFYLGSKDPLRDGSIKIIYKMVKNHCDVKGYEFKDYIHGFYGLNSEILSKNPLKFLLDEVKKFLEENK